MRLIDADALEKIYSRNSITDIVEVVERTVLRHLKDAPTIDAVEVVRCKECKHGTEFGEDYNCRIYPEWYWFKGDHFCADGERRTSDD